MKLPEEIPEVVDLRAWLEWVATEHWDLLAVFVLSGTPVSDGQSVRDVVHEAMLKILLDEVGLLTDGRTALKQLLTTIGYVARNWQRREKVRDAEPLESILPSPEEVQDGRDKGWKICQVLKQSEMLDEALGGLSHDRREVLTLRYLEDWTIAEIAEHRGSSPRTVRNLIRRALAELRAELEGLFAPE